MNGLNPLNAGGGLDSAVRRARLAQADHLNAVFDIRDAKQLRLVSLQADLAEVTADSHAAASLFDLVLTQGEPPRLWIDGTSYVVMEPDPRSYRFMREGQDTRETLLETRNRSEMLDHLVQYMAHRIVERERNLVPRPERTVAMSGYSGPTLVAAWFGGLVLGVVLLLIAGTSLGFLRL